MISPIKMSIEWGGEGERERERKEVKECRRLEWFQKWPAKNKSFAVSLRMDRFICTVLWIVRWALLLPAKNSFAHQWNWVLWYLCYIYARRPQSNFFSSHRKSSRLLLHNTLISCMDSNAQYKLIYEFMKWYFHFVCFDSILFFFHSLFRFFNHFMFTSLYTILLNFPSLSDERNENYKCLLDFPTFAQWDSLAQTSNHFPSIKKKYHFWFCALNHISLFTWRKKSKLYSSPVFCWPEKRMKTFLRFSFSRVKIKKLKCFTIFSTFQHYLGFVCLVSIIFP